jgi:hypothetical protein
VADLGGREAFSGQYKPAAPDSFFGAAGNIFERATALHVKLTRHAKYLNYGLKHEYHQHGKKCPDFGG